MNESPRIRIPSVRPRCLRSDRARALRHPRARRPRAAPCRGRGAHRRRRARLRDRRARRSSVCGGEAPGSERHRLGAARVAAEADHRQPRAGGLRKEGSGFDLSIALAVLAASRQIPPTGSPSTPRSASWRWTVACDRCAARSPSPKGRGAPGSSGSSVRPSRPARPSSAASRRSRSGTSPRPSPIYAASFVRRRQSRPTRQRSPIRPTWPTSAARSALAARSSSPPRAATTCCSPARPERARRCSDAGCRRSCLRSSRARRSR